MKKSKHPLSGLDLGRAGFSDRAPYRALAMAVALCCAAGSALAQQAAPAMTAAAPASEAAPAAAPQAPVGLQEYLQLVVRNQPRLAADRLQISAAQADSRTAAAFPNPTASYGSKPGEKLWGIEQPLPIFGQRRLRMENARKGEATARANVDVAVVATLGDAAQAFIDLLMAQQRLAVWKEAQEALNNAGRIVLGQIEAGARSRYDGARLNLQQAQMAMQVNQAQSDWLDAASHAAMLAALPHWEPRAAGSLQAVPVSQLPSEQALWEEARQRLPALVAAQAELDQLRHKIELERREALPTPSVSVARVRNRLDGNYNQIGVSMELPLFDRREGQIARAQVEAEQAQLRYDAALIEARTELQRALKQLKLRRDAVRAYEKQGLAQIAPLHQMAQDAYKLGQGSILELIDSLGSINEHRLEHLDLVKEMLLAEWQVRVASGTAWVTP
ncbi:TolC family protein [Delftia sp. PS-11]|uniref:TolC family protein n=1 Tax=Delftia sp. PS-11 TaxID=2767222 RepID=UPI0024571F87|nr:TolC family protein [Delftia sp. PS-11]KAJ8742650.1 TolC family protein [Delftia sp. PS-11]